MLNQLLGILIISVISMAAACKKRGCTDEDAMNFDKNAKETDNSCQYLSDPYVGTWNGVDSCYTGGAQISQWVIERKPGTTNLLTINYLSSYGLFVDASFNGNQLVIPLQEVAYPGGVISIEGSGTISSGLIQLQYALGQSGSVDICVNNSVKN